MTFCVIKNLLFLLVTLATLIAPKQILADGGVALPNLSAIQMGAQGFTSIQVFGEITPELRAFLEIGGRATLVNGSLAKEQIIIRPALGYKIAPGTVIWIGYGHFDAYGLDKNVPTEERTWQELETNFGSGEVTWTSRTRIEERFVSGQNEMAWRLRQLLRGSLALDEYGVFSFVFQNEVFYNLTSQPNRTTGGFSEDRLFIGLNHKIAPWLNYEAGYLLQYLKGSATGINYDNLNHTLALTANLLIPYPY